MRCAPVDETRAGSPADHKQITCKQRAILLDATLAGIRRLLASVKALLDAAATPGSPDPDGLLAVAGGLYTYALEEYGKAILLDALPEKGGAVSVPYREIFRTHRKKFDAAIDELPAECNTLRPGIFDPRIFDRRIFDVGLSASFSSRTRLFYLDMSRSGGPIMPATPSAKVLAGALCGLERAVAGREARGRLTGGQAGQCAMDGGHRPDYAAHDPQRLDEHSPRAEGVGE